MNKHISEQINGLRGFMAIFIMCAHYYAPPIDATPCLNRLHLSVILSLASEFVSVFLMLSGFFAYYSYVKKPEITIGQYLKKRAVRIYPIYIIALVLAILAACICAHSFAPIDWWQILGNVLCLQDNNLKPGVWFLAVGGNIWYMSYQWWDYVFFILLMKLVPMKHYKLASVIIALVGMATYMIWPNHLSILLWYYLIFAAGCYLAECYVNHKFVSWPIFVFIPIMLSIWMYFKQGDFVNFGVHPVGEFRNMLAIWVVLLIYNVMKRFHIRSILGIDLFKKVSPYSFSIYMFQIPFMHLCNYYIAGRWTPLFVAVACTMIFSYLIEVKTMPWMLKNTNFKQLTLLPRKSSSM